MDQAPPSAQSARPPRPTEKGHYYKFNEDTNNWEDIGWLKYCFMRHNKWWEVDKDSWASLSKTEPWPSDDYHRLKTLHWVEKVKVGVMQNLVDKKKKELKYVLPVKDKMRVKTDSELSAEELEQLDQLLAAHNHIENIGEENTRERLAELTARFQTLDEYLEEQKPLQKAAAKARQAAQAAAKPSEEAPPSQIEKQAKQQRQKINVTTPPDDLPAGPQKRFSNKATASRLAALRKKLAA